MRKPGANILSCVSLLIALTIVMYATSVVAEDAQICTLEVVNPTCKNGTQGPTDVEFPCITEEVCSKSASAKGIVDCIGWICSLRLNCGCFAGQVTSCAANATTCNKDSCRLVVRMFEETSSCKYEDYLGPRDDPSMYQDYIEQCLAGCNHGSVSTRANLNLVGLIILSCLIIMVG